jgi:L-aspartate oxidase
MVAVGYPLSPPMNPDFIIIGAGVAGLRAAIELAPHGRVLVIAKDSLSESSSAYAQGGIAAALSDDDDIELHEQDTLIAGDGLCDPQAVRTLVEDAPSAIYELIDWGAEFDREGTRLMFAREGAHSRSRVLHAHGDSTGREIARTLYVKAASLSNIEFRSYASVTDLLLGPEGVSGAVVLDGSGDTLPITAGAVLLATGGLGRVFLETTNPDVATGDGVAMGWRARATIRDIEFVQFHPTALHVAGAPRFLLSEALRGEGAYLRNPDGERFMHRYDDRLELAPRDVVSRSIVSELQRTGAPHAFLDLRHLEPNHVRERFPRIYSTCMQYGVDIAADLIPVHPAAHYAMGGVATDLDGRTDVGGLYAAGEVACTGVHGANRLASNSLLEGLVFGARAGRAMLAESKARRAGSPPEQLFPSIKELELRGLAWRTCGLARDAAGLQEGLRRFDEVVCDFMHRPVRSDFELRNMHTVAGLIARAALARQESRGGHFRLDFPQPSEAFRKHSEIRLGAGVEFLQKLPNLAG